MKAMCPKCLGKGCPDCQDGEWEVSFAEGDWYTCQCLNFRCLFQNGGNISKEFPGEPPEPCVVCGFETKWVLMDDAMELPSPAPYEVNHWEFRALHAERSIKKLLETLNELRHLALISPGFLEQQFTTEDAELLKICRICKGPDRPLTREDGSVNAFAYGPYAHVDCVSNGSE